MDPSEFRELLYEKGRELYRSMPWREDTRPYYVLVSELMLQQTQVERVVPKFENFIAAFPDEAALARAGLADVLTLWQGLGYNRRARFLHEAAREVVQRGAFPADEKDLLSLPGVGKNTAGAIRAYAFNQPALFIETNVRTVYFYHFFTDGELVDDKQILPLLEATLDCRQPREFYWALMDYGTQLKRAGVGKITQSKHYKKQSALKGSVREVRGQIIKQLALKDMPLKALQEAVEYDNRFEPALAGLVKDQLVTITSNQMIHLTK